MLVLSTDEHLSAPDKEKVQERLNTWITEIIGERLKPLVEIAAAKDLSGMARGIAFRLLENFGGLRREAVAEEMRTLDQPARAKMRAYGVRFGAFNIYFPVLLKPASAELALVLWALKHGAEHNIDLSTLPEPPRAGLTSLVPDKAVPEAFYRIAGFHSCGTRAVRFDMLERLADLIRPLVAWRADPSKPDAPPKGATGDGGFRTTPEMMSILGCSANELGGVLQALGFRVERVRAEAEAAQPADDPAGSGRCGGSSSRSRCGGRGGRRAACQWIRGATRRCRDRRECDPRAPAAETQEPKWDEIWRPRRPRGPPNRDRRPRDRAPEKPRGSAEAPQGEQTAPAPRRARTAATIAATVTAKGGATAMGRRGAARSGRAPSCNRPAPDRRAGLSTRIRPSPRCASSRRRWKSRPRSRTSAWASPMRSGSGQPTTASGSTSGYGSPALSNRAPRPHSWSRTAR